MQWFKFATNRDWNMCRCTLYGLTEEFSGHLGLWRFMKPMMNLKRKEFRHYRLIAQTSIEPQCRGTCMHVSLMSNFAIALHGTSYDSCMTVSK